jgi:hypothetical protein
MKKVQIIIQTVIITAVLSVAASYAFAAPGCTPPGCNVAAPIDVSSVDQVKPGSLTLGPSPQTGMSLIANSSIIAGAANPTVSLRTLAGQAAFGTTATITPSLRMLINGNVGATAYCDMNGNNCSTAADIQSSGGIQSVAGPFFVTAAQGKVATSGNLGAKICFLTGVSEPNGSATNCYVNRVGNNKWQIVTGNNNSNGSGGAATCYAYCAN